MEKMTQPMVPWADYTRETQKQQPGKVVVFNLKFIAANHSLNRKPRKVVALLL
jgi:hypothetical protein